MMSKTLTAIYGYLRQSAFLRFVTIIAPLEGGLPSREPQILKSLILFVCVLFVRIFAPNYRMVSAPAPNADFIGFIFQGSKTGSVVSTFKGMLALQRGPKKSTFFYFCSFKIRLLWCPPQRNRDRDIPAICWLLGSEVPPFRGADCPAGPN